MAVHSVAQMLTTEGGVTWERGEQISEFYIVILDSLDINAIEIVNGDGRIPELGAQHPDRPWLIVMGKQPRVHDESGLVYIVEVEYGQRRTDQQQPQPVDPLTQQIEFEVGFARSEREAAFDVFGVPILNTAGDTGDPNPSKEKSYPEISVSGNVGSLDVAEFVRYSDAVNSDYFGSNDQHLPHTAKIVGARAVLRRQGRYEYWHVSWTVRFSSTGHRDPILNQGMNHIVTEGEQEELCGDIVPVGSKIANMYRCGEDRIQYQHPLPLAGDGTLLPQGSTPLFLTSNGASIEARPLPQSEEGRRTFGIQHYPALPFKALPILGNI